MTPISSPNELARLESVMELIDQAMFLLSVHDDGSFTVAKLNESHSRRSGMDRSLIEGRKPHEVLPQRMADTVCANYRQCARSGESFSYEELLDLSDGAQWWLTTLTPITDLTGNVVAILGTAVDVTQAKTREIEARQTMSSLARLNADLQVFASINAQDVKGPVSSMAALIDLVTEDFVDLGDGKLAHLQLCRDIAERTVVQLEHVAGQACSMLADTPVSQEVSLAHICADIFALSDAEGRLDVRYPDCRVAGDTTALQVILHRLVGNAVRHARTSVSVGCSRRQGGVSVTVADDGRTIDPLRRADGRPIIPGSETNSVENDIVAAIILIEGRGGSIALGTPADGFTASIVVHLPDMQLVTEAGERGARTPHPGPRGEAHPRGDRNQVSITNKGI